jgi:hypothetical protein
VVQIHPPATPLNATAENAVAFDYFPGRQERLFCGHIGGAHKFSLAQRW